MIKLFDIPTVEKIHNEIDSAQEKLLEESLQIINSIKINEIDQESVYKRYQRVGFENIPIIKDYKLQLSKVDESKRIKYFAEEKARLIQYYKDRYPFLKFLTEDELDRICKKYKLIYSSVKNYAREVPLKNLKDIENAQELLPRDRYDYKYYFQYFGDFLANTDREIMKKVEKGFFIEDFSEFTSNNAITEKYFGVRCCWYDHIEREVKQIDQRGLFICAPKKHFQNLEHLDKSKFGYFNYSIISPKDPIVFRYVRGGVQILTKWGAEASDAGLVNPIEN